MPFPRDRSVVDFFHEHALVRPGAIAIKFRDISMDYQTLDRLSNRLANHLLGSGLQLEDIVAIPMIRSCAYVIAALGTLKAGGSYLPVDLTIPDQLLNLVLKDSGTKFACISPETPNLTGSWDGKTIVLDDLAESLGKESESAVPIPSDPNRRAYVIYTSGSTGKPKGVEIEHHSLTNLVCFYHQWLGMTPTDRAPLVANIAFDASVADLWPVLCAGGTIHIPPMPLLSDLDGLIEWLRAEEITGGFIPTGLMELMLKRPWPKQMALRYLGTGGDTLHTRPPAGLPFMLINQYGPTENTVDSTWAVIEPQGDSNTPTIGRPIGNVTAYVLNEAGERVATGEEGELFLGGEQVARGYLNQPELTQERFPLDPFAIRQGARMYRTGDWVRLRHDGELDFHGRRDLQIQIRGRRVELGEIEQHLHTHPAVSQACCVPVMDGDSVSGVTAHVSVSHNKLKLADTLRRYLAERLPAYMVPTGFIFYDQLPLTNRGKVDRAALRKQALVSHAELAAASLEGSIEQAIVRQWFTSLPNASLTDVHSTFESLGGDSLGTIKLLLKVEEICGRRIPQSTFLMEPTLPGLLRMATKSENTSPEAQLITLRKGGNLPPIFCLYGFHGDISHYIEFTKALGEDQPVFGIRAPGMEDLSKLPQTMEEAGAQALKLISEIHLDHPPILVGYSWAGYLAFEVARQWQERESTKPLVVMIGAPGPRRPTSVWYRIWHFFRWLPAWLLLKTREGRQRNFGQMFGRLLKFFIKDPVEEQSKMPDAKWASPPIAQHFLALGDRYFPASRQPMNVHLFRETLSQGRILTHPLESSKTDQLPDCGWGYWTKKTVQLYWIDTDHDSTLYPPKVNKLAEDMQSVFKRHNTSMLLGAWGLVMPGLCLL